MGVNEEIQLSRRLGTWADDNRRCAVLVTVASKDARDKLLAKVSTLKQTAGEFSKIYIKKDVHSSIRKKWRRLYDAEKTEKARPENSGRMMCLDTWTRKLYKDGVVIDEWNHQFL